MQAMAVVYMLNMTKYIALNMGVNKKSYVYICKYNWDIAS